jgi:hypothetical protein
MTNPALCVRCVRTEFTHGMNELDRLEGEIRDEYEILDDLILQ